MANHALAIAKASLAAGMMRPDPTSVARTEIAHFHALLEAVLKRCSSANIQLCKDWLLDNVIPSASRINAVVKYLVALCGSFKQLPEDADSQTLKEQKPSGRRRQLYILYLMNDLLHHTKCHVQSSSLYSVLTSNLQPYLVDLLGLVSAHSTEIYEKHHEKIQGLLDIWSRSGYYQNSYIQKLRETVANAARLGYSTIDEQSKADNGAREDAVGGSKQDAPYIMPASHGDASIPFYDLPAGNMLPHIIPNSATPINSQLVKPLQFMAGPADESLVTAIKSFLRDVESFDDVRFEDEGVARDVNQMGQFVVRDEITGDVLEGDGYYGWSRVFCEKMKKRGDGIDDSSRDFGQGKSVARNISPRKRRYSDFGSSRSRSRGRSSSVRSRQDKRVRNRRDRSVSSSRSRSPSNGQNPYRSFRSRSRSISRSSSYSPPPINPPSQLSTDPRPLPKDRTQRPPQPQSQPQPPPPFVHQFPSNFPPTGPGGLPIPPPPPPNYNGPWPPPPPPMMPGANNVGFVQPGPSFSPPFNNPQSQLAPTSGSWGQQQQQMQSRPNGSYLYGGRGRAQASFIPSAHNGRGRGFEHRGGWSR